MFVSHHGRKLRFLARSRAWRSRAFVLVAASPVRSTGDAATRTIFCAARPHKLMRLEGGGRGKQTRSSLDFVQKRFAEHKKGAVKRLSRRSQNEKCTKSSLMISAPCCILATHVMLAEIPLCMPMRRRASCSAWRDICSEIVNWYQLTFSLSSCTSVRCLASACA